MKMIRRLSFSLASIGIPLVALAAGQPVPAGATPGAEAARATAQRSGPATLVEKVRRATERYRDINVAYSEGWVQATPCVSGPDFGAMGVHLVNQGRLQDRVVNAELPEALIYEPLSNGAMRLVGVEFIALASLWNAQVPKPAPPAVDGNLMNFVASPNRFGLPDFYELHVWAWEHNPVGSFADWNTAVTCERQPDA